MKTYYSKQLDKNVTVPDSPVTKMVGGYEFSLEAGQRYIASRPLACKGRKVFPVSIRPIFPSLDRPADAEVVIDNLSYDEANALLDAFNNGVTSFGGRVW